MSLWLSLLPSIFKRRDVAIFLSFMIVPILVPILSQTLEGTPANFGKSFLHFLDATMMSQYRLTLPVVLLSLVIASVFKDEIDSGILFLYKDINRTHLFQAKLLGLVTVYAVYAFGTLLLSAVAYYGFMRPAGDVSGLFFPSQLSDTGVVCLSLLATILLHLITITVVSAISIVSKTLITVLTGVFFSLLMTVAPLLTGIRYLVPNGYLTVAQERLGFALVMLLTCSGLYLFLSYRYGLRQFKKVEF